MEIKVTVRNVYGVPKIYPACEKSRLFALIADKKTLDKRDLNNIRLLGFAVVQVLDSGTCIINPPELH